MSAMERTDIRRRVRLKNAFVEVWENPDVPFACGKDAVERYVAQGEWVFVFNALVLATVRIYLA